MDSLEKRLDAVLADRRKRILASLPTEEVAEMYRRMKAEQSVPTATPCPQLDTKTQRWYNAITLPQGGSHDRS